MTDIHVAIIGGAGLILGLFLYFYTFRLLRLRRAMADTPTSKVRSAAMGRVELKGLAKEWEFPLQAPFSNAKCAWFKWKVEEEQVVHTSKGTRRRWVEKASKTSARPFELDDNTGSVKIDPAGAEITAPKLMHYTSGGLFRSTTAPVAPMAVGYLASPNRVRLTEWRIDLGLPVYTLGTLGKRRLESGEKEDCVTCGKHKEPYLISTKTEEEMRRSMFWKAWGSLLGGSVLTLGCGGWLLINFVGHHFDWNPFPREAAPAAQEAMPEEGDGYEEEISAEEALGVEMDENAEDEDFY